jgi:hypothetical protein
MIAPDKMSPAYLAEIQRLNRAFLDEITEKPKDYYKTIPTTGQRTAKPYTIPWGANHTIQIDNIRDSNGNLNRCPHGVYDPHGTGEHCSVCKGGPCR